MRFILFILTISLSVGLFIGASSGTMIAKESYIQSFINSLEYTDYVIKPNNTWLFNSTEVIENLSSISEIEAESSRLQLWARLSLNTSFLQFSYVYVVGVDWTSDSNFGNITLTNGSNLFLLQETNETLISTTLSEVMGLHVGDTIYIRFWRWHFGWVTYALNVSGIGSFKSKVYDFDINNPDSYWEINRAIIVNKRLLEKIFGNQTATHMYIHVTDPFNTTTAAAIESALGSNFTICKVKERIVSSAQEIIDQVTIVVSLIYSMGFIVSFFVIVNIIYQSLTEWRYYLGLLKTIGYSTKQLLLDFIISLLASSTIGCVFGLPIAILSMNLGVVLVSMTSGFEIIIMNNFFLDPTLVYISLLFGISVTLISGSLPSILFLKSPPLKMMKHQYHIFYSSRNIWFVIVSVFGFAFTHHGLNEFLTLVSNDISSDVLVQLLFPFLMATIGLIIFFSPIFVLATPLFALFFIFSKKIHLLAPRNLLRNKGRTFFSVLIISFAVAFLISGQIVYDSFVSTMETQVYISTGSDITIHGTVPSNVTKEIAELQNVRNVVGVRRIWAQKIIYDDKNATHVEFYAINSTKILDVIYKIQFSQTLNNMTTTQVIEYLLQNNHTIILQDYLLANLSVHVGENITWMTPNGKINMTVIGSVSLMAGAWETIWVDYSIPHGYFMALICYNTVQTIYPHYIDGDSVFTTIFVDVLDPSLSQETKQEILSIFRKYSIIPNSVYVAKTRIEENMRYYRPFYIILQVIFFSFIIISSLTLITNLAYILYERRYEIGVLRSMGFLKSDILVILFSEIIITVLEGALSGISIGYFMSWFAISKLPSSPAFPLQFVFSPISMLFLVMYLIGLFVISFLFFFVQLSKQKIIEQIP